jgi:deazaflavin-dependent oxidoreductase (nitroreductase family)
MVDRRVNDDADYCYITTVGRVSGRPHTVEIWFALRGRTLYVLAGAGRRADFVRNAMKMPDVTVRIGSRRARKLDARARIVTRAREDALARRMLLEKYARAGDDLDEWGRTALPVALDLGE